MSLNGFKRSFKYDEHFGDAKEYNASTTRGFCGVVVEDFPLRGDKTLSHTYHEAFTNSRGQACIKVHGLTNAVPFKYIAGLTPLGE